MNSLFVSVILINYNGKPLLERFLPSVANLNYSNYEVVVVDNASTDGSAEFIRNTYPNFKIVIADSNYGTAEGSNIGAREARGEYLFFVSNDMEPDKNILNYLIEKIENDLAIGVTTCKMLRITERSEKLDILDSLGSDADIFGFPTARGINEVDNGQWDFPAEVFFSFGGALLIKKDLYNRIGGYDEKFFTLVDDTDLCWRVHLLGLKVMVEPKAFLYHRVSATLGTIYGRSHKRFLSERNTLRMLLKNYSTGYLFFILPLYFVLLFLEMIFFIVVGKPIIAKSVVNAIGWNFSNLKDTLRKRKLAQNLRKARDNEIWKLMQKRSSKVSFFFDFLKQPRAGHWKGYFG